MKVSNADRVVFPDVGVTKGQVVDHYIKVAEEMWPHIEGRALTVERYPKGIASKGFMQKNAPEHLSDELISVYEVEKEEGGTTRYPVPRSPDALAVFANLGVITFHVPPSTVDQPQRPDWAIWDLDPPDGQFELARRAAVSLREYVAASGVDPLLMTSGSSGYHLRVRLDRSAEWHQVAEMVRGVGALAAAGNPDLMTLEFKKKNRGDRVFVDWLRNAPLSTSVVPWSLRARSNAPVATPIAWEEIGEIDPNAVTISDVGSRLDDDLWDSAPVGAADEMASSVSHVVAEAGIELQPFDRFRS